jgi:solute carrier family 25 S-adenosylmethionine transporter 26
VVGSAPGAALFFCSYEAIKSRLGSASPKSHMIAAAAGEAAACLVRVPTENVKQKMQAGLHATARKTVASVFATSGAGGFYTGYWATLMREIPFSLIQFPLYEQAKVCASALYGGRSLEPYESAACGSISGKSCAT